MDRNRFVLSNVLWAVSAVAMAVALSVVFLVVPREAVMGERAVDRHEAQILDQTHGEEEAIEGVAGCWLGLDGDERLLRGDGQRRAAHVVEKLR